jgi:hypothetical protein
MSTNSPSHTQDPNALSRVCVVWKFSLVSQLLLVQFLYPWLTTSCCSAFAQASGGGPRRLTFIQFYSKLTPTRRLADVCKTYTKGSAEAVAANSSSSARFFRLVGLPTPEPHTHSVQKSTRRFDKRPAPDKNGRRKWRIFIWIIKYTGCVGMWSIALIWVEEFSRWASMESK